MLLINPTGRIVEVDKNRANELLQAGFKPFDTEPLHNENVFVPAVSEDGTINVKIVAPVNAIDGYGHSAETMMLALRELGVNAKMHCHDHIITTFSKKEALKHHTIKDFELIVVYHLPMTCKFYATPRNRLIGFTMWETDTPPPLWAQTLNENTDRVFVPAEWNARTFKRAGLHAQCDVIPLGIDLSTYKYIERPKRETFTFLTVAAMDNRKNPQAVIRGFVEAFQGVDNVRLVIKTRRGHWRYDLDEQKIIDGDERIKLIDDDIQREELMQLYTDADCFVFPSRGEGFGLPPREAMSTGLPVIVTNWSALEDIAKEDIAYPLKVRAVVPAEYPSWERFGTKSLGKWAEPDQEHLVELMQHVYHNQEEARARGIAASKFVQRAYHPHVGAQKIIDIIRSNYI